MSILITFTQIFFAVVGMLLMLITAGAFHLSLQLAKSAFFEQGDEMRVPELVMASVSTLVGLLFWATTALILFGTFTLPLMVKLLMAT